MEGILRKIFYFLSLNLLWAAFTWQPSHGDLAMGAVASLVVVIFFDEGKSGDVMKFFNPMHIFTLLIFTLKMTGLFIASGFVAAAKIVNFMDHPVGEVSAIKLKIRNDSAKAVLAGAISLFPNMVVMDIQDQNMYVYCLDGSDKKIREMVSPAENMVGRIFEK